MMVSVLLFFDEYCMLMVAYKTIHLLNPDRLPCRRQHNVLAIMMSDNTAKMAKGVAANSYMIRNAVAANKS